MLACRVRHLCAAVCCWHGQSRWWLSSKGTSPHLLLAHASCSRGQPQHSAAWSAVAGLSGAACFGRARSTYGAASLTQPGNMGAKFSGAGSPGFDLTHPGCRGPRSIRSILLLSLATEFSQYDVAFKTISLFIWLSASIVERNAPCTDTAGAS
jgi:hypothetical protein